MRRRLRAKGYEFVSDTDTEVIAHLVHSNLQSGAILFDAVRKSVVELVGAYAIAVVSESDPSRLVVARHGAPLLLGLGEGENFAASDTSALVQVTQRVVYLEDGDCAELTLDGVRVSDSGGKADTIAALQYAKSLGHRYALSICNVPESSLVRSSHLRFLTRAGPEIGVASTKAFTTQLAALALLTMTLAKMRGRLPAEREAELLHSLRHLPRALERVLHVEPQVKMWSEKFAQLEHALFLGRGIHYPIAMEGALKLKEISYIHAEAYAAGELKHGPLALVDKNMPVIAIAPKDALLEKLKSNLQEVRARGGELHVLADEDTRMVAGEGIHVIRMPDHAGFLSPILHTVPLQLLAYHAALERGNDVDKPRNLAKSVTVE